MDLKLEQKDVAKMFGVCEDSITGWETGRSEPMVTSAGKIIQFLGYNPYVFDMKTLGGRIKHYRYLHGLSCGKFGKMLGVDSATVSCWETGKYMPSREMVKRINMVLQNIL